MNKKLLNFCIGVLFICLISSCTCDPHGPCPYNISGTITFTDTIFRPSGGGYFAIAIFSNNTDDLYHGVPSMIKQLNPKKSGNTYSADYSVGEFSGINFHYVTVAWIKTPYNSKDVRPILGTSGCGTDVNCNKFNDVLWTNNTNVNFNANSDTSKRIFYNIP